MTERLIICYERVSSDKQDIGRQAVQRERAAAEYPERELEVIQDDGVSAYKIPIFDRPGGRRLCELIEAGNVEAVYTDAQDRLSRGDDVEWVTFRALCESTETRVIIDGRELRHDLGGRLEGYLKAALAREESKEKAHRTRSGMRRAAAAGRSPAGQAPLGYRRGAAGRYEVEPREAETARRIFSLYLEGVGVNRIAATLNDSGARTRRGARFSARVVLEILGNPTYIGHIRWAGEIVAENAHEALIEPETWARVQTLRAAKRTAPAGGRGRPPKEHLLAGLLYCPNGHAMLARRNTNGWAHYRCSARHSYGPGACDAPAISRQRVDEALLDYFLLRRFDVDATREQLVEAATRQVTEAHELAAAADRETLETEEALIRIRKDYRAGRITAEDWAEFRTELQSEQEAAAARAAQLRVTAEAVEAEAALLDAETELLEQLQAIREAVAGRVSNAEGLAAVRVTLASLFERVIVQPKQGARAATPVEIWTDEVELALVPRPELTGEVALALGQISPAQVASPPGRRGPRGRRS